MFVNICMYVQDEVKHDKLVSKNIGIRGREKKYLTDILHS